MLFPGNFLKLISVVLACFYIAEAGAVDEDLYFIEKICLSVMKDNPRIPRKNASRLCHCSVEKIGKVISEYQRLSIRVAKNTVEKNGIPEKDLLKQSGVTSLVKSSQRYCENNFWPSSTPLSEKDQRAQSLLANKSIAEYTSMLKEYCDSIPKQSAERKTCLIYVAKEWLSSKGGDYADVDDRFITANDLAWEQLSQ